MLKDYTITFNDSQLSVLQYVASQHGMTPQEYLDARVAEDVAYMLVQEVKDWWDSLTPTQKRSIYQAAKA